MRIAIIVGALSIGALALSCSDSKSSTEVATEASLLLKKLAAVREMPATAPIGPNQHFLIKGDITFHTPDKDIKMASEVWLAGPERMRFQLGDFDTRNTFTLYDPKHCWMKAGAREVVEYDAAELLTETALRWEVLRFPWGWEDELAELSDNFDADRTDFKLSLTRESTLGELTIELDKTGLPKFAALGGSAVELSDWAKVNDKSSLVAKNWSWKYQAGKRTETIAMFREAALFQDEAFRPVVKNDSSVGLVKSGLDDERTVGDEFGILNMGFRFLNEEQATTKLASLPQGEWWQADEQRYFILRHPDPELTKDWSSSDTVSQLWLRWSTYSKVDRESGITSMKSVMSQTGYHATGPCWALDVANDGRARRSIFLMPVEKD